MISAWVSRGRLFPALDHPEPWWRGTYAALPFAAPGADRQRPIYFSGRDANSRSHVGACVLDLDSLTVRPGSETRDPLLAPGMDGDFDQHGCSMACLVRSTGLDLLFYTGWTLTSSVPFVLSIGVAASEDGGRSFQRVSRHPVMAPGECDPCLCASPSILIEDGLWRMWYTSGIRWEHTAAGWRHYYHIKYAESADGSCWRRDGRVCIDFSHPGEYAIGRPHVIKDGDVYRMWYCWRGPHYRIGYAESDDGLKWRRLDDQAGAAAPGAWDAEMQAYPMVFRDGDKEVMLYNGNGFGATGFGCATRSRA